MSNPAPADAPRARVCALCLRPFKDDKGIQVLSLLAWTCTRPGCRDFVWLDYPQPRRSPGSNSREPPSPAPPGS